MVKLTFIEVNWEKNKHVKKKVLETVITSKLTTSPPQNQSSAKDQFSLYSS